MIIHAMPAIPDFMQFQVSPLTPLPIQILLSSNFSRKNV